MATELSFEKVAVPDSDRDETPPIAGVPFDPQYPDSTPEAPYGYRADGTPYKRHHGQGRKARASSGGKRMPASDAQARGAAGVLATANKLIAMALNPILPKMATELLAENDQFEDMAYDALLSDPVLCKKILGAGSQSGKVQLAMAYGALALSVAPTAATEIRIRRAQQNAEVNEEVIA